MPLGSHVGNTPAGLQILQPGDMWVSSVWPAPTCVSRPRTRPPTGARSGSASAVLAVRALPIIESGKGQRTSSR
jgi:hypothetical protein